MAELTEEKIAELKAKHGNNLTQLDNERLGTFVIKPPSKALWSEFMDRISDEKQSRSTAFRKVAFQSTVFPDTEALAVLFEQNPNLPAELTDQAAKLISMGKDFDVKKL